MTDAHADPDDPLITVEVRALPVELQVAAQQHTEELTRELLLVAEQLRQQGDSGALPHRFVELVGTLSTRYSGFTAEQQRHLDSAAKEGRPSVDLVYQVPLSAAAAAASLGDILAEADEYCRAGRLLLTLQTPPLLVRFRRWFLDQFVAQAAGQPPVSWPDYLASGAAT